MIFRLMIFLCAASIAFAQTLDRGVRTTGAITANNCAKWDSSGRIVDAGAACGGSSTMTSIQEFKTAVCNRDTGANWSQWNAYLDPGAPVPICYVGNNHVEGFAYFENSGTNQIAQFSVDLPSTWTGTIPLDLIYVNFGAGTAGSADQIKFNVQTKCIAAGATQDGLTFNTAQSVTGTASSTTNRVRIKSTLSSLTTTGCSAGDTMIVRVTRDNTVANNYNQQALMVKSIVKLTY